MKQGKATWSAVHAVLLDQLRFRANSQPLTVQPDQLDDLADQLADVVVGRFEIVPRAGSTVTAVPREAVAGGPRIRVPRDPFSYVLELRRRYVRDWYWMGAAVVTVGLGVAHDAGTTHPSGLLAGLGVMAAGLIVGYLGYRRGKSLR